MSRFKTIEYIPNQDVSDRTVKNFIIKLKFFNLKKHESHNNNNNNYAKIKECEKEFDILDHVKENKNLFKAFDIIKQLLAQKDKKISFYEARLEKLQNQNHNLESRLNELNAEKNILKDENEKIKNQFQHLHRKYFDIKSKTSHDLRSK